MQTDKMKMLGAITTGMATMKSRREEAELERQKRTTALQKDRDLTRRNLSADVPEKHQLMMMTTMARDLDKLQEDVAAGARPQKKMTTNLLRKSRVVLARKLSLKKIAASLTGN